MGTYVGRPQLLQNVFSGWNFADDVAALGVVARDWFVGIFGVIHFLYDLTLVTDGSIGQRH
jgi:hypothetical protein